MSDPWVEKYRPIDFKNIVLDESNKHFFTQIMDSYIPNMLFYGPPGTGKTTTIINIIKAYQKKRGETSNGLMIHLNASDERGIDTIRTQIYAFVQTKPFFKAGTKFVILDEIDSMTKNAQQALGYMLHTYVDVRFCLICNYISKIDPTLQTMFIKIKFNKLPKELILSFLEDIIVSEKLEYTRAQLEYIQSMYETDIRSMINFIQMNQANTSVRILHTSLWDELYIMIKTGENINVVSARIYEISKEYCLDVKHILKEFVYYVWITYTPSSISKLEIAFHSNANPDHMIRYIILCLN
jgi:replication factor C subunit 3/5